MRKSYSLAVVLVVLLAALGGVGGYFLSHKSHSYSAQASLVFRPNNLEQSLLGNAAPQLNETPTDAATEVLLVNRRPVIAAAARQLGLREPVLAVQGRVTAAAEGASNIVNVKATGSTSPEAVDLANAVAHQFVVQQQRQQVSQIAAAQRGLTARMNTLQHRNTTGTPSPEEQAVATQQATLAALAAVNPANAAVIQTAVGPAIRTGHSRGTLVAVGVIIGLIVGLLICWLVAQSVQRRRTTAANGLAGFGERAYLSLSRGARRAPHETSLNGHDSASVSHLAVALGLGQPEETRVVLCAPTDASVGEFDLAWRLAQASAELGSRTLYVMTGWHSESPAAQEIIPVSDTSNLSALNVNGTPGSETIVRLRDAIDPDRRHFDVIVVHGSSVAEDATSLRLAAGADAVVLCSGRRSPEIGLAQASLSALGRVGAPPPGFVSLDARPA